MRSRAKRQHLDQCDAQHHPRLRIRGKRLPRRAVDQRIQIRQVAQCFRDDGVNQRPVCRSQPLRRPMQRQLQRIAAPQHGVE